MIIEIDFNSDEAIYLQLRNQIICDIASNHIKEGDSLPSVRQLALELGVNMHTVNKAYSILRQDGYLQLDRRYGAVVALSEDNRNNNCESIKEDMRMIAAEAICSRVSKEDLLELLSKTYDEFKVIEELLD